MGGHIDSLKLVSSLTLFQIAARKIVAEDAVAPPELSAFDAACDEVLEAAERQGFPRCAFTLEKCDGV
jgi:hypothetical protein